MKPVKHKIGFWLLISLIPATILFLIGAAASMASEAEDGGTGTAISALCFVYAFPAGIAGLILPIWGNIKFSRDYKAARRYAERHGWHTISRTSWRNRKRNNIALSVAQAFKKQTYILNIDMDGETVSVDEFETATWALEFADWLWEELLHANVTPNKAVVEEKRAEWETTALAVRSSLSILT